MSLGTRFCQRCHDEIPMERVKALPDTVLCVDCSREVGGDYQVSFVAENLAKSGSLKKNWGAWTIKKTRRSIRPK